MASKKLTHDEAILKAIDAMPEAFGVDSDAMEKAIEAYLEAAHLDVVPAKPRKS